MDIVENTFRQDGLEECVEMVKNNDTRVIQLFSRYGVAFKDQVESLLDLEMGIKFGEDIRAIEKAIPEFKKVTKRIIINISDPETDFDFEIMSKIIEFASLGNCEVHGELERCLNYYVSFYTDVPDFDPYPDDVKEETEKENEAE